MVKLIVHYYKLTSSCPYRHLCLIFRLSVDITQNGLALRLLREQQFELPQNIIGIISFLNYL